MQKHWFSWATAQTEHTTCRRAHRPTSMQNPTFGWTNGTRELRYRLSLGFRIEVGRFALGFVANRAPYLVRSWTKAGRRQVVCTSAYAGGVVLIPEGN